VLDRGAVRSSTVSADDFVIQEAGAAREILSVRPGDYPIVLLLDTGIDARGDFPMIRKAAAHFIERIGQRPLAIGTLGGVPALVTGLDDERETVMARLAALEPDTNAPSALLGRRVAGGADDSAHRRALFGDHRLVLRAARRQQRPPDAMIASIIDSNAILHVVQKGSDLDLRAGKPRKDRDLTLRAIAEQSRGEFTDDLLGRLISGALDRLADRLTPS